MAASTIKRNSYQWLSGGNEIFPALTAAIDRAVKTIRLEVYTYANDELGRQFLETLVHACRRGLRVQVLIDAFGSITLNASFWDPFVAGGGQIRWFNPQPHNTLGYRDHRKMLVCDEEIAFIGGFNISEKYMGDGVTSGWCDLGLSLVSPLAVQLAAAFDEIFAHAGPEPQKPWSSPTHSSIQRDVSTEDGELLLGGPSRGRNPFKRTLHADLLHARSVQIISAYFLPTSRIRRVLMKVARRGGRVQLLLPGKSDVLVSQFAARSLYRRLLKAGVEIYEYQPQILHAKLIIIDQRVYAGSSNLDPRSLYINYELMVRFENQELVSQARKIFAEKLEHSKKIELEHWRRTRTWWRRFKHRWAYFLLVRVDPLIARWKFPWSRR